ncbi:MAG: YitT family protein [Bacteroidetes bacterium]|nr:YitT family protein [Bacteroidota bacterium]MCL6098876.1 YitT family protein [Bacteroidota bacterium]
MVKSFMKKYPVIDYFAIAVGSALMSIGIGVFLVDARVVPGGVSGLAMALYYLSGNKIPIGILIWVLNIPLFIWGLKELGKKFGLRTFVGFSLNSFFIDFFRGDIPGFSWIRLQDSQTVRELYQKDFLFLILIGAVLLGIGLGIIFKFKGTTAGSDIIASILHKRFGFKPGQSIMVVDFVVIAFAGFIIDVKNLSPDRPALVLTFYAIFLLFISSRLIDILIDGFDYARAAYIISDKFDEISEAILKNLGRGVTAVNTRGVYLNVQREMLLTVVPLREVTKLVDVVKEVDPTAFVIIYNVHEVLGEGFRRRI